VTTEKRVEKVNAAPEERRCCQAASREAGRVLVSRCRRQPSRRYGDELVSGRERRYGDVLPTTAVTLADNT